MAKIHIPANKRRLAKEARRAEIAEAQSKANPSNQEIKDLIILIYKEIQDLREQLKSS